MNILTQAWSVCQQRPLRVNQRAPFAFQYVYQPQYVLDPPAEEDIPRQHPVVQINSENALLPPFLKGRKCREPGLPGNQHLSLHGDQALNQPERA